MSRSKIEDRTKMGRSWRWWRRGKEMEENGEKVGRGEGSSEDARGCWTKLLAAMLFLCELKTAAPLGELKKVMP